MTKKYEFKPGDSVVRKCSKDNSFWNDYVTHGEFGLYTVRYIKDGILELYDVDLTWDMNNFELMNTHKNGYNPEHKTEYKTKFKVGDNVIRTRHLDTRFWKNQTKDCVQTEFTVRSIFPGTIELYDLEGTYSIDNFELANKQKHNQEFKLKNLQTNEVKIKMEMKNIKQHNLKEAKKQYDQQKANAEITFALGELRRANDYIDNIDREIKVLNENKKPFLDIIKRFK